MTRLIRDAARWLIGIAASLLAGAILAWIGARAWDALVFAIGTVAAVALMGAAVAALSLLAALVLGPLRLPGRAVFDRVAYAARAAPFVVRDALSGFAVARGRRNRVWPSKAAFIADDPRREGGDQTDYGVAWYDRRRKRGHRVSFIHDTDELVAVEYDGVVELLAVAPEYVIERRLARHGYAAFGGWSLPWIRRRAVGWDFPLPPRARYWQREDLKPPTSLPPPPPPSLTRTDVGSYHGVVTDEPGGDVFVVCGGEMRPLYHYVCYSPTGFAWGYAGAGPSDLARSILADRLGYPPTNPIAHHFRDDIIARLDRDFVLPFADVDAWIDANCEWFARYPRAELQYYE